MRLHEQVIQGTLSENKLPFSTVAPPKLGEKCSAHAHFCFRNFLDVGVFLTNCLKYFNWGGCGSSTQRKGIAKAPARLHLVPYLSE